MMREAVAQEITAWGRRYGLTVIERDENCLLLKMADLALAELLECSDDVAKDVGE